ncbi:MAG: hypothetical protein FWE17_00595 [Alphaproteobacteria bacterium]|nr:hypothetical protein [Alphaproteobacteria bacterium]MCL2758418.1 hypothetical protein [Alphaproteobacteria bacterium]
MRFSLLSKPKIEREHFLKNKEIDPKLIGELSVALDNLDIEKIKSVLKELSKTHHRISTIFETLGISKSGFYKMLSSDGNPEFITILRLLNLFDIKLQVEIR